MASTLEITGLEVRYGRTIAVTDINLSVAGGEAVALVGRNGAGKSSLLRAATGLETATGTVIVQGRHCHHEAVNAPIAYVAQRSNARWDLPLTVLDVVLAGCRARGSRWRRPTAADRQTAVAALDTLGIRALARHTVGELSGGQAQRVLLARAFTQRPDVLLLDEPFAGLDTISAAALSSTILEFCAGGMTVVCALHELDIAREVFPRTVAIDTRVIADGPTERVLDAAGLERIFIGDSGFGHSSLAGVSR